MDRPFKELKVIELANVLAGPAVGMFFAELGAQVIKIENEKAGGDVTRNWKLPSEKKDSVSAYYASVNWNKKTIFLDLSKDPDREKVYEMIRGADIVISNYKKGDAEKLQMHYSKLREINPSLIHAHISGFGKDNSRTAFDIVLQAESGFMFMNGTKESGPVKMPVALIDILAAHQLKEGILVALIRKMKTGKGASVNVSLYDAAIASLANQATNWLMAGHDPQRSGSLHPNIAPYGEIFNCKDDRLIALAVGSDKQFNRLCEILGEKKLPSDPRFISNTQRVKNREALFDILAPLFLRMNAAFLMTKFLEKDVPAGLIRSVADVLSGENISSLLLKSEDGSLRLRTAIFDINN